VQPWRQLQTTPSPAHLQPLLIQAAALLCAPLVPEHVPGTASAAEPRSSTPATAAADDKSAPAASIFQQRRGWVPAPAAAIRRSRYALLDGSAAIIIAWLIARLAKNFLFQLDFYTRANFLILLS